ncbi:MAG: HAMP domain-containing protein [Armatimonadetes bacterium]|nr:HAMP domain-containing protein [Armatimonadota bacterium]NDK17232.1 HAMP domain-containing protein [Armatimonadota bacterium]PIX37651.1 MAG: hypothetical protein COZ57_33260 [Armatimonadetes bacterium CG_4_8_14_3_um_filter_66_20]
MLRTLHGKLLLTHLAITVLGLGILGVYLLQALNDAFLDQVKLGLMDEAKLVALHWGAHHLPLESGEALDREATRVAEEIGVTVVVTDRHCHVLAHSPGLGEGVELRPEVPDALRGRVGLCVRSGPKIVGRRMHIAYPIRDEGRITGVVRLAVPLSRIDSQLAAVRRAILMGMALLVVIAIPLSLVWSERLSTPLQDMSVMAAKIAGGDFGERVEVLGEDEVGQLGRSLNTMAAELERLFGQLEAAAARERDFSGDVSHELRTPLATVRASAETLLFAARDDREAQREFLGDIILEAARMERLVDDLLQLARIESGTPLKLRPVSVAEVVEAAVAELRDRAQTGSLRLDVALTPALAVLADPDSLRRVLTNLLENAVAHTPAGGRVSVVAREVAEGVELAVEDTGCGIAPEHLPHLFERFYRADTHRSRQSGGTGLGLAIVKRVIAGHGSRITVQSEPGKGSRFAFVLPAAA